MLFTIAFVLGALVATVPAAAQQPGPRARVGVGCEAALAESRWIPPDFPGYLAEVARVSPEQPHTIDYMESYLHDALGAETLSAVRSGSSPFVIVVGDGPTALKRLKTEGWQLEGQVEKGSGYYRIHRAKDPAGNDTYVVTHVNGRDRVIHVQGFFKLAGLAPARLRTIGELKSWKAEYRAAFARLGYVPVFYGWPNSGVAAVMKANPIANAKWIGRRLWERMRPAKSSAEPASDLSNQSFQIIEFENGKRLWLFNSMYGDLAGELLDALYEHGARNITYFGTAGGLNEAQRVRDIFTPKEDFDPGTGESRPVGVLKPIPGVPVSGRYVRVATSNTETQAWLDDSVKNGVDVVEMELGYFIALARAHPELNARAALVLSEVLRGPNRKDMRSWSSKDTDPLAPEVRSALDATLGATGKKDYAIRAVRKGRF
ncbi:MAG: hypothetical protein HY075_00640 [Deltaproteobacteria bacterium]|nr:hypothetical protein [Deltaproteobacteria bacterium]